MYSERVNLEIYICSVAKQSHNLKYPSHEWSPALKPQPHDQNIEFASNCIQPLVTIGSSTGHMTRHITYKASFDEIQVFYDVLMERFHAFFPTHEHLLMKLKSKCRVYRLL